MNALPPYARLLGLTTRREDGETLWVMPFREAVIGRPRAWFAALGVLLVLVGVIYRRVPSGFIPSEDKGYFAMAVQLPDGAIAF